MSRARERSAVFLWRGIESLRRVICEVLFVFPADAGAGLPKGINQRGVSPDFSHCVHKNGSLHREQSIPQFVDASGLETYEGRAMALAIGTYEFGEK